jgi:hypothetical protein
MEVEDGPEHEEGKVGSLASDEVGDRSPQEPSSHIKDAQDTYKAHGRGGTDLSLKQILNHGRCLFQDADAGCYVDE